jgi:hypothetical protein
LNISIGNAIDQILVSEFTDVDVIEEEIANLNIKVVNNDTELKPYTEKVKNRSAFDEKQSKLTQELEKVKSIKDQNEVIEKLKSELNLGKIKGAYESLFNLYKAIIDENHKYKTIQGAENLEISSTLIFSNKKFEENFLNKIDKRGSFSDKFGDCFNRDGFYQYSLLTHVGCICNIIDILVSKKVALRQGFDYEHSLYSLLDDYFSIDYNLIQDGDDLLKMSPGKRGIILFQLFLHLSKSNNPILIDQPEDNLDNRTVYQELNEFIKNKKVNRQIIIVSHNPNLVVSTDSENVIVANQSGQNKSGKNRNYQFEYVNGGLENSFKSSDESGVLYQSGIKEHVCDILEGGIDAFEKRETKYSIAQKK